MKTILTLLKHLALHRPEATLIILFLLPQSVLGQRTDNPRIYGGPDRHSAISLTETAKKPVVDPGAGSEARIQFRKISG
jgi:hypothetical protein